MTFRIYALRGTGPWWLIDTGPDTPRAATKTWHHEGSIRSNDGSGQPHKWFELEAKEVHLTPEEARFSQ